MREVDRFMNNLRVIDGVLKMETFKNVEEVSFSFETLPNDYAERAVDLVWKYMPYAAGRDLLTLYEHWDQQ